MTHHNGKATSPPMAVARNMGQLAHDVVELAELQSELVKIELRGWWKKLVMPSVLLLAALVGALSCTPVLILSTAYGLAAATSLGLGWCLLIAASGSLALSGLIGLVGWNRLKAAQAPLSESRRELGRNIRWIKAVLKEGSRPSTALAERRKAMSQNN